MRELYVVYKFSFPKRIENKNPPYYYIGCKSNCEIIENKIFSNKDNKFYWSSSNSSLFKNAIEIEQPIIEILYYGKSSKDILEKEVEFLVENKADISDEYFNMFIPPLCNFTWNDYATYKNKISGKYVRLRRNHPEVLNGNFVGTTSGVSIKRPLMDIRGEKNPFYGKKHTKETIMMIMETKKRQKEEDPETYYANCKAAGIRAKKLFSGVQKTKEHKEKIGKKSKGKFVVKNRLTHETKKISVEEYKNIDKNVWTSCYSLRKKGEIVKCPYCFKEGEINNSAFLKWHFDNCRSKNEGT